ncbi:MAG: glycosyltransferase [Deltaproteobacteria bacterium]|nr:glycosyltransferase [Deltaproteobacteria bacterium]
MIRVAWFSPIAENNMLRSAAFTRRVLEKLGLHFDVELFIDDSDWSQLLIDGKLTPIMGVSVFPYQVAFLRNEIEPFDAFVYHMEDAPECAFVKTMLAMWPGIVFFHDLAFNSLELALLGHATTETALNAKMVEMFGDNAPRLGDWQARGWPIEVFSSCYPMGWEQIKSAEVLVLSSEAALRAIANCNLSTKTETCAVPVDVIKDGFVRMSRRRHRRSLDISSEAFMVGFQGTHKVRDRIHAALEGFALFKREVIAASDSETDNEKNALWFLWIVGSAEEERDAEDLVESKARIYPELQTGVIIATADLDATVLSLLSAVDVMLAMSFSPLSPAVPLVAYEAFARGILAILSDDRAAAEIPTACALRVQLGKGEREMLAATLRELYLNEGLRDALRENARAYIDMACASDCVSLDVRAIIEEHRGSLVQKRAERQADMDVLRKDLIYALKQRHVEHELAVVDFGQEMRERNSRLVDETLGSLL